MCAGGVEVGEGHLQRQVRLLLVSALSRCSLSHRGKPGGGFEVRRQWWGVRGVARGIAERVGG